MDEKLYASLRMEAQIIATELMDIAKPEAGDICVVGCSSSEIAGKRIGKASSPEIAQAVLDGILPVLKESGVYLAAQCCEHLNRALVLERVAARMYGYEEVYAVPQPDAGGAFSAAAYSAFSDPVVVEWINASCGIDIGGTLIGMHLKAVAVPLRLSIDKVGEATINCARTRPKYIGGARTKYEAEE